MLRDLGIALVAVLGSGCEPVPGLDGRTDAVTGGSVTLPPAIMASRAVDRDRLHLELTVNGDPVPTVILADGRRQAELPLVDDAAPRAVVATWNYDLGDGTSLTLARSRPVALSFDRPGGIVIDDYDGLRFDADGDGATNIEEIDANRDPLYAGDAAPLPAAGSGQEDCRLVERDALDLAPGLPAPSRAPTLFTLQGPLDETLAVTPEPIDGTAFHAVFSVQIPGNILVEDVAGLPVDTDALLYESRESSGQSTASPILKLMTSTVQDPADGIRARLPPRPTSSFQVDSGIYCYVLFKRLGENEEAYEPLLDTSLRIRFEP